MGFPAISEHGDFFIRHDLTKQNPTIILRPTTTQGGLWIQSKKSDFTGLMALHGNRVELTDEAQVVARELAKRVRALMAEVQPTTK